MSGPQPVIVCPVPDPQYLQRALLRGRYQFGPDGLERACGRCGELWPADTEFFHPGPLPSGLHSWCKACYEEMRREKRRQRRPN